MGEKYKSLGTGSTPTIIPKFQPVKMNKDVNRNNKKVKDEHTNSKKKEK